MTTQHYYATRCGRLLPMLLLPIVLFLGCHGDQSVLGPVETGDIDIAPVLSIASLEDIPEAWEEIPEAELAALVALYEGTDGDNWDNNVGWLDEAISPSEWHGVTVQDGRVIWLNLGGNNLRGEIPLELADLGSVERLLLHANSLSGNVPPELGGLGNLRRLSFGGNNLTGEIPPELGRVGTLRRLTLGPNELSGQIPTELGDLGNLQVLGLGGNNLSGEIPGELGRLAKLEVLSLSNNSLSGEIPRELGDLESLEFLVLPSNDLSGEIPPELGNLGNLQSLVLSHNNLSGQLPPELGDLVNLTGLLLNQNDLSGPLPQTLTQLGLNQFWFSNTDLCEPPDEEFQTWLDGIEGLNRTGVLCEVSNRCRVDIGIDRTVTSGDEVLFGQNSSCPAEIVKYEWDFGDGAFAQGALVEHRFSEPSPYQVRLTVTDVEGNAGFDEVTVEVSLAVFRLEITPPEEPLGPNPEPVAIAEAFYYWERDAAFGSVYRVVRLEGEARRLTARTIYGLVAGQVTEARGINVCRYDTQQELVRRRIGAVLGSASVVQSEEMDVLVRSGDSFFLEAIYNDPRRPPPGPHLPPVPLFVPRQGCEVATFP